MIIGIKLFTSLLNTCLHLQTDTLRTDILYAATGRPGLSQQFYTDSFISAILRLKFSSHTCERLARSNLRWFFLSEERSLFFVFFSSIKKFKITNSNLGMFRRMTQKQFAWLNGRPSNGMTNG